MAKTALNFSKNYKYGVVWSVTDSWWEHPELWIKTGEYGSSWKFLSPGNKTFNYGVKMGVWYP